MAMVSAGPWQVRPANGAHAGYGNARELAALVDDQFAAYRFVGVGVAGGSCCAAVAVVPGPGYAAETSKLGNGALPYGVVYGNSQMMGRGLALLVGGGHAERAALTVAAGSGLTLYTDALGNAVLYVELIPCPAGRGLHNCSAWLGLTGAPMHPYAAAFPLGATLNVWYGHAGTPAMGLHHGLALPAQIAAIGAW